MQLAKTVPALDRDCQRYFGFNGDYGARDDDGTSVIYRRNGIAGEHEEHEESPFNYFFQIPLRIRHANGNEIKHDVAISFSRKVTKDGNYFASITDTESLADYEALDPILRVLNHRYPGIVQESADFYKREQAKTTSEPLDTD